MKITIVSIFLCLFTSTVFADQLVNAPKLGVCKAGYNYAKTPPDQVYRQDEFAVYYTLTGDDALVNRVDANRNAIPDVVEDVATQLVATRQLLSETFGFTHPLQQPRFAKVNDIRVKLINIKGNGVAYDEPHQFPDQKANGGCSLMISLSNDLSEGTLTPSHELFHLFQYGYTMFKARWFLEGTARWSESVLGQKQLKRSPIPTDTQSLQAFFEKTYDAIEVWNQASVDLDSNGYFSVPTALSKLRYVSGRAVVEDNVLFGAVFIKGVFEAFDRLDDQVAR